MRVIIRIPIFILKCLLWIIKAILGKCFGWIRFPKKNATGKEFEKYAFEVLKRLGYKNIKMTRQSGDYGIDLLAQDKKYRYAIQCKFYSKPVGVQAVMQAYSGCEYYGYDIPVVMTNQTFTRQAMALASRNGVLLWDGETVKRMQKKANAKAIFCRDTYEHPYNDIIKTLLSFGYASSDILHKNCGVSLEKAYYILDDMQFHNLVSSQDEYGIRELYFETIDEAIELYGQL